VSLKLKTFIVEGSGLFPVDMLRYDACWPTTSSDSALIAIERWAVQPSPRRVSVMTREGGLTDDRWLSFGWKVLS
jgi:hypothetical protein